MKVAVVGSRSFKNYKLLKSKLDTYRGITLIISGGAIGADSLAERYAEEKNIKIKVYKADWDLYGSSAGFLRNIKVIDNCEKLIAFWDGRSNGTNHSITLAKAKNKPYRIFYI